MLAMMALNSSATADEVGLNKAQMASIGFIRANDFSRLHCSAPLKPKNTTEIHNEVQVVASHAHGFVFFDNVKAGSSTVRQRLENVLQVNWGSSDITSGNQSRCFIKRGGLRMTSKCMTSMAAAKYFKFGIARDPVDKFESGVRQAWHQDIHLREFTADALLLFQLHLFGSKNGHGQWLNEHLKPTTVEFMGRWSNGVDISLDYIGNLETLDSDWRSAVGNFRNITFRQHSELQRKLPHTNARSQRPTSLLSELGVQAMCTSKLFEREWDCLGYPRPKQCTGLSVSNGSAIEALLADKIPKLKLKPKLKPKPKLKLMKSNMKK